jgi:BirA family transcriptional regulator, biotin operon repressor / biotin---[acetyl-CoA-carboxylase] ligase
MAFALAPAALAAGYWLRRLDTVGSTNTEALALGRAGEPGPLWVVSDNQTAGRGRRGNSWSGAPGNLAASLLLTLACEPACAATLGFVAGLAVRTALERIAPGPSYRLKWPNDVLANRAKLAGILLESESIGRDRRIVVLGIGVNVVTSPRSLPYQATCLAEFGNPTSAEAVFAALSDPWVDLERMWDRGRGMRRIRKLWLDAAMGLGQPIAVRLGAETARGAFETIDEAGQLILRRSDGSTRAIPAGEVHFGEAGTARELA